MPEANTFIPYHVPVPSRRPTSVLVLGILGIVLASLTILGAIFTLGMLFLVYRFGGPTLGAVVGAGPQPVWQVVQMTASFGFYSVLLWASIAAIRLRPRARVAMVRWAAAYLTWLVVETVLVATWVLPAVAAAATPASAGTPPAPFDETLAGYVALVVSVVFAAAYPVCVIVFMRKAHVRAAFEQETGAPLPVASFTPPAYAWDASPPMANTPAEPLPLPPVAGRQEP